MAWVVFPVPPFALNYCHSQRYGGSFSLKNSFIMFTAQPLLSRHDFLIFVLLYKNGWCDCNVMLRMISVHFFLPFPPCQIEAVECLLSCNDIDRKTQLISSFSLHWFLTTFWLHYVPKKKKLKELSLW